MTGTDADIPFIGKDIHFIEGTPLIGICSEETLRSIPDISVFDDDIYVAGYPKTGSQWVKTTVTAILRAEELQEFEQQGGTFSIAPLEFDPGYKDFLACERPRVTHTHIKYEMLPRQLWKNKRARVIHIMRNPKDVAVSYYNFAMVNVVLDYKGSWSTFFDAFMAGHVPWGSWYHYMANWMKYKDEPNVLFVKYEEFKAKPQKVIKQLAEFLGKSLGEDKVEKIAELVSFNSMKSKPGLKIEHFTVKGDFLRKGVVGDWVNYFTPEQDKIMDEMYHKLTTETGVELDFQ